MVFSIQQKHIVVHTRTGRYAMYSKPPKQYNFLEALIVKDQENGAMHFMVYLSTDIYIGDTEVEWRSLYEELPSRFDDDILASINNIVVKYIQQKKATTSIIIVFNSAATSILLYRNQILPRVKAPETVDKFMESIGFKDLKLHTSQVFSDIQKGEETVVYLGCVDSFSNAILDSNYNWRSVDEKVTKRYDAFLLYTLNLIESYAHQEITLLITEPSGLVLVHDSYLPVTNNILEALDAILLSVKPLFDLKCVAHCCWRVSCAKAYKTTNSRYRWVEASSIKEENAALLLAEKEIK